MTAKSSEQQRCTAGKNAIAKGRRKAARVKAIPGKQAVRELLGVERDFSYILERLYFIFHYIQRSHMNFYFYINRIDIYVR